MARRKGYFYLPGRLYDAALGRALAPVRRRVAREVDSRDLYPCLDICCGTGLELRTLRETAERGGFALGLDKSFRMLRYGRAVSPFLPVVAGDAFRLPFRTGVFRSVTISFALHDKSPDGRTAMAGEAKRVLAPGGEIIIVDFERPWDKASRRGALLTQVIERFAREPHYGNGREFLRRGGLRAFLAEHGLEERWRRDVPAGSFSIVGAAPK